MIPRIATLISCIPIIPLIPFPQFPILAFTDSQKYLALEQWIVRSCHFHDQIMDEFKFF